MLCLLQQVSFFVSATNTPCAIWICLTFAGALHIAIRTSEKPEDDLGQHLESVQQPEYKAPVLKHENDHVYLQRIHQTQRQSVDHQRSKRS